MLIARELELDDALTTLASVWDLARALIVLLVNEEAVTLDAALYQIARPAATDISG